MLGIGWVHTSSPTSSITGSPRSFQASTAQPSRRHCISPETSGNRELPLVSGEMQCRLLGCAVEAWNDRGEPVIDEVGELVCTQPIPSMPLYLWGDVGKQRYLASYFDTYPGVWRHGDWLKIGRH